MNLLSRTRLVASVMAVMLFAAACGSAAPDVSLSSSGSDASEHAASDSTAHGDSRQVAQAQPGEVSAEDLRITLERQLGQHAVLAIQAMRAGVSGKPYFDAAAESLARNTEDLTESIRLVYGDEGAQRFNELWSNHIGFFVDYTVGLAEGDQQAQDAALKQLDQYRQDFGAFLEGATNGELPQSAVAELLQMHVNQLVAQVDAFAAENYDVAAETTREAYAHMFATAKGLAEAIVATQDGFDGDLNAAPVALRSSLGQLLGEHALLAVESMRSGVAGEPDFEANAAALNSNTEDLTAAITGVFGEEGGQAFMEMWANHIDFFVQYTVGLAEDDQQAQDEALERLEQYRADFSQFLDTASQGNIPASVVSESLQTHVNQLVEQVDSFAAEEYAPAFDVAYESYNHMYETAAALAGGIVAFTGDTMPTGGVQTGGGGTAGH